ncbi:LOC106596349 [Symbiodinium natans]|uniref:LOC106596349 protein n=1 Tax=Symbiodinium natans TaxID=878477 RepID=A0A812IA61_9DINO|nr:LOC106596349 [Symbiodinium natans]
MWVVNLGYFRELELLQELDEPATESTSAKETSLGSVTKIHKTHELCQLALTLKLQEDLAEETDVDAGTSTSSSISEELDEPATESTSAKETSRQKTIQCHLRSEDDIVAVCDGGDEENEDDNGSVTKIHKTHELCQLALTLKLQEDLAEETDVDAGTSTSSSISEELDEPATESTSAKETSRQKTIQCHLRRQRHASVAARARAPAPAGKAIQTARAREPSDGGITSIIGKSTKTLPLPRLKIIGMGGVSCFASDASPPRSGPVWKGPGRGEGTRQGVERTLCVFTDADDIVAVCDGGDEENEDDNGSVTKIHKTHELCQLALTLKLQEDLAEETDVDAGTSTSSSISEELDEPATESTSAKETSRQKTIQCHLRKIHKTLPLGGIGPPMMAALHARPIAKASGFRPGSVTKIHKTHELCQLALMLKLQEDLAEETDVDAGTSTSSSISEDLFVPGWFPTQDVKVHGTYALQALSGAFGDESRYDGWHFNDCDDLDLKQVEPRVEQVLQPQLAKVAAEAGAKLDSELDVDFGRVQQAHGQYRAAQAEIAKELTALSSGTTNLQAQIPAEHAPLLTKIEEVLEGPAGEPEEELQQQDDQEATSTSTEEESQANVDASTLRVRSAARVSHQEDEETSTSAEEESQANVDASTSQALHQEDEETSTSAEEESQANPDASTLRVRSAARVSHQEDEETSTSAEEESQANVDATTSQALHQEDEETSTSAEEESQANPDASTLRVRSAARVSHQEDEETSTSAEEDSQASVDASISQALHQEDEETSTSAEEENQANSDTSTSQALHEEDEDTSMSAEETRTFHQSAIVNVLL